MRTIEGDLRSQQQTSAANLFRIAFHSGFCWRLSKNYAKREPRSSFFSTQWMLGGNLFQVRNTLLFHRCPNPFVMATLRCPLHFEQFLRYEIDLQAAVQFHSETLRLKNSLCWMKDFVVGPFVSKRKRLRTYL